MTQYQKDFIEADKMWRALNAIPQEVRAAFIREHKRPMTYKDALGLGLIGEAK